MSHIQEKLDFLVETEKLKAVLRKTRPTGLERFENTAEHSWQVTIAALLFMPPNLDALKVLKMLLIHDIVEIDAGDVFVYDDAGRLAAQDKEQDAANRIFGLLPSALASEFTSLWQEFEARETGEAIYAKAMDRVLPVIQNLDAPRSSWNEHNISRKRVIDKNTEINNASSELWSHLLKRIEIATFDESD